MSKQESSKYPGEEYYYLSEKSEKSEKSHRPLLVILAIFIVLAMLGGGTFFVLNRLPSPSVQCSTTQSSNPVKLSMYYDTETQDWMNDAVKDFNSLCQGKVIVELHGINSGQSVQDILNSQIQPDIWNPAGSIWLEMLNQEWQKKNGNNTISSGGAGTQSATILAPFMQSLSGNIVSTEAVDAPSLVKSPIVIAMWKPMAQELGWSHKPIWWADIASLSTNPQGWAAYGHPEWGTFKFEHTNPYSSDSGLDAVIAENYAAVHKSSGLTTDDVNSKVTQDFVSSIESSVIYYGDSTDALANEMFTNKNGMSYLSAAVMDESMVAQANAGKYGHLVQPLVAIYPQEGTLISDHPFVIPQASWVTSAKKDAALSFRNFLLDTPQQNKALQYGLRPSVSTVPLGGLIDSKYGVDSSQPTQPSSVPSTDVAKDAGGAWGSERNKMHVMLLLDVSGSMNDSYGGSTKIAGAKDGLKEFISLLSDNDELGLTTFNDQANVLVPVGPLAPERQRMLNSIDSVVAGGNTRLFNTVSEQQAALQNAQLTGIKALIVLTDGIDDVQQMNTDQLTKQVTLAGENAGSGVRIFTIAYGNDANANDLTKIATVAGGEECKGNQQNIKDVYNQIEFLLVGAGNNTKQAPSECSG